MKISVIYFGTSTFAVPPLEALLAAPDRFDVKLVVTRADKPAGRAAQIRQSPVAQFAVQKGLPLFQPTTLKDDAALAKISALQPDIFVVAAYGKIIPKALLDVPKVAPLNLHGSILPKYRGASPIQAAILAGEHQTGVSLMIMDEEIDHGPVVGTVAVPISAEDTYESLEKKLAEAAAALLVEKTPAFVAGDHSAVPQDHSAATFTKLISKNDGFVSWRNEDAGAIVRKVHAYDPWPQAFATWMRKGTPMRVKILGAKALADAAGEPGTVRLSESGFPVVAAKTGSVELLELQLEGKNPQPGDVFIRGYKELIGSVLNNELI